MTDGDGHELEAGIELGKPPLPFVQLFAGYRRNAASFESSGGDIDIETGGPVIGVGVNF